MSLWRGDIRGFRVKGLGFRVFQGAARGYMSYSLNSLKGAYIGDYIGVIRGDTRSLDYSSYGVEGFQKTKSLCVGPVA